MSTQKHVHLQITNKQNVHQLGNQWINCDTSVLWNTAHQHKQNNNIPNNMNASQKHFAKWKKSSNAHCDINYMLL